MMKIPIVLGKKADGAFYAKTLQEPDCCAEGRTKDEAVKNIREEIRYRLEVCACAWLHENAIEIEVRREID